MLRLNPKVRGAIGDTGHAFLANGVTLLIAALVVLILPKVLGIADYSYWQLYLFYVSYVAVLQYGWADGVYLRYGGAEYSTLDRRLFGRQFVLLVVTQLLLSLGVWILAGLLTGDLEKVFIIRAFAVCLVLSNARYMLDLSLQATGRVKLFAHIGLVDRLSYFGIAVVLLVAGAREYQLLIVAHIAGRFLSVCYGMWACREVLCAMTGTWREAVAEARRNVRAGIKLVFATLAGVTIVGLVRLGVEQFWDVETFGRISLILSASSAFTVFTASMGIVMYPVLKRVSRARMSTTYAALREMVVLVSCGLLLAFYPLKSILVAWLPGYAGSFIYLPLLLPVFVYSSRATLLTDTVLKVLRLERSMLVINVASLALCAATTYVCAAVVHSLLLAVLMIPVWVGFRTILGELVLARSLNRPFAKSFGEETLLIAAFMLSSWLVDSWMTTVLYGLALTAYMVRRRSPIRTGAAIIREAVVARAHGPT